MTAASDPFLGAKLRAIRTVICDEVKPELSSPQARLRAELIDMLLARFAAEADGADPGALHWEDDDLRSEADREAALAETLQANPQAPNQIAAVAAGERTRRNAYEDQVAEIARTRRPVVGSGDELAISVDTFATYLRGRLPDAAPISVERIVTVPGGRSKGTLLVDFTSSDGARQIVVRKDFGLSVTGTSVSYEFPIVRAAFEAGLPAPEPLWLEDDAAAIGGKFIAFSRVGGRAMGSLFASDASPAFCLDFAGALARLHAVDIDAAGIGQHLHFGTSAQPVREMIEAFYARYRRQMRPYPLMDAAFAWLRSQLDQIGRERALVHGDAGLHNVMGEGDRLTALLDWEFAHAGDPAEDLAYCRYLVSERLPWDDFIAAYRRAGGRPISPERMRFFTVWRTLHLSVLTGGAREAFERGADQDLRIAAIGYNTFPKQLRDLANDLAACAGAGI